MILDLDTPEKFEAAVNALRLYSRLKDSESEFSRLKGDFDLAYKQSKVSFIIKEMIVRLGVMP